MDAHLYIGCTARGWGKIENYNNIGKTRCILHYLGLRRGKKIQNQNETTHKVSRKKKKKKENGILDDVFRIITGVWSACKALLKSRIARAAERLVVREAVLFWFTVQLFACAKSAVETVINETTRNNGYRIPKRGKRKRKKREKTSAAVRVVVAVSGENYNRLTAGQSCRVASNGYTHSYTVNYVRRLPGNTTVLFREPLGKKKKTVRSANWNLWT